MDPAVRSYGGQRRRAAILAGCGEPDLSGEATLPEDRRTTPRSPSTRSGAV
ncbi:MAG: hypothetical protein OXI22_20990 [Defluviicoccus sp.]|nr:hypothetical protein [Defluviicoccus sp.]MDE0386370.1 hypothetical protein [Defluviicoccus sp.]